MKLSVKEEEALLSHPSSEEGPLSSKVERPSGTGLPVQVAEMFRDVTYRSATKTKGLLTTLAQQEAEKKRKDKESAAGRSIFSRQYAHAYASRLWELRPGLQDKVKEEWQEGKKGIELKKIAELCESTTTQGQGSSTEKSPKKKGRLSLNTSDHEQHIAMREDIVVAVIGTLFKQQPEKPSILQELVEEKEMVPVQPKARYISDKDVLLLEDETTRVQLVPLDGCGMKIDTVVNGVVCAVRGKPTINGKFEVEDVLWATPKPSVWPKRRESDIEMIFVSGLRLGSNTANILQFDLLCDYLLGISGGGCPPDTERRKSQTRLFLVGELFGDTQTQEKKYTSEKSKEQPDPEESKKVSLTHVAKKLDAIVDQLAQTMEVYIIPGNSDPAEPMFPQAPIHRCILPISSLRPTFHSMCNPTRLHVPLSLKEDKKSPSLDIILTGGQNVVDAMRNTSISSSVEMGNTLLRWGHLCPTAPDTLPLHPGIKDDLFILKDLPNIFVIGGQAHFGLREWKDTTIVSLPRFVDTGVAIMLDKSLNFIPLNIKP